VSSSDDGTTGVGALLDCSLLDCDEDWTTVSSPETMSSPETASSPEDNTTIVGALSGSSLLECSSPENCGSAAASESELSRDRIQALWIVRWSVVGCIFPGRNGHPSARLGGPVRGIC
jgi:hypothetical protein